MSKDALSIKNLSYTKNRKSILKNVDLQLKPGKIVALLGENGSGKTTLMRIIAGVAKNWQGKIEVNGEEATALRKENISFTDNLASFPKSTKIAKVNSIYKNLFKSFDEEEFKKILDFMNLNEDMRLGQLSKGMKEKLVIALAFSKKVDLYLLDEPFSGIDIMSRKRIINSIILWKSEHSTILISEHFLNEIDPLLDEVLILKDKRIIEHRSADEIRSTNRSIEEYYTNFYANEE